MMMTIATNNTTATQPCDPACRISRLVQLLIDAPEEVGWAVLCKSGYETLSQPRISAEATEHLESLELGGLQLRRRGEAKI